LTFSGHDIIVINNNWALDITTFTGYRTYRFKTGDIRDYKKALKVYIHKDGSCNYKKYMDYIPVGVMRKIEVIINNYKDKNFLD